MNYTYKRSYSRVPIELKEILIQLVFRQGYRIKDASLQLKIKYANAKTIIFSYRQNNIKKRIHKGTRMCSYAIGQAKIKVISQTAGRDAAYNLNDINKK